MKTKCDMCGSDIVDGKCACGEWFSPEEMKNNPMKMSIEQFHEMKRFTVTGDAPHLGCGVVYFRGDYNDCKKIEKYIHEMKIGHIMNREDLPENYIEYHQECDLCTMTMTVVNQKDDNPEYYTDVFIQCQCGNFLEFNLPVN